MVLSAPVITGCILLFAFFATKLYYMRVVDSTKAEMSLAQKDNVSLKDRIAKLEKELSDSEKRAVEASREASELKVIVETKAKDEKLKAEMQSILDKASETLDYEIGLLRCLNPLSDKLRDILLSIEKFGSSTKYPFKDPELERMKHILINLCADLRARFTGYDRDEAQKLGERNLESVRLVNEFEKALRELVQKLNG